MHPTVCPERYLICVETGRVWSVSDERFITRKPLWLFSSLYWPLPKGWQVRVYDTRLYVFSGGRPSPTVSSRKNGTFVVRSKHERLVFSTRNVAAIYAKRLHLAEQRLFTEKIIAVQRISCLVSMFLGQVRSSRVILKLFTEHLTIASSCQTALT